MEDNCPIIDFIGELEPRNEDEDDVTDEENLSGKGQQDLELMMDVPLVSEEEAEDSTSDDDILIDEGEESSMNLEERLESISESGDENNDSGSNIDIDKCDSRNGDSNTEDSFKINEDDFYFNIEDVYEDDEKLETEGDGPNEMGDGEVESKSDSRPRRGNAGTGVRRLEPSLYGKEYTETVHTQFTSAQLPVMRKLVGVLFTQMSAKKGFRQFGDRAIASMLKELKQLHTGAMVGKPVIEAVDYNKTTVKQRKEALEAVALMKLKRTGDLKSRVCANGKKQRWFLTGDEDFSSPTAMLESIFLTLVIDALEDRDVAVVDIPGAYLHALLPEGKTVLLVLRDELVDIMCTVDKSYKKYVIQKGNRKVLYLRVIRALYGCLESALLWYNLYSSTLQDMGFILNPYDNCVANKMIDGKQCTIAFYVDDNKISHKDSKVVSKVIEEVTEKFGKLTIQRGNKFDLLGMDIEIKNRKVHVSMKNHLRSAIDDYERVLGSDVSDRSGVTPAKNNLYDSSVED